VNDDKSYADHYLKELQKGNFESAFFGLLESRFNVLPHLIHAFQSEKNTEVRASLVKIIWEIRKPECIPLLNEALYDSEPSVWKEALNGLVTLASTESLGVLQSALNRSSQNGKNGAVFRKWIEEAIEQTSNEMKRCDDAKREQGSQ